ncbi:methylated-DNA--[protein]-cysteine S-methyltransferase [Eubacteriales bacterium OttesenSCG-928-A19]|nr:methylated-DNA--[protein]-cysteine S-methyltransferase [Eubacteriales bacterium OttesenSCG-928-A19]
MKKGFYYRLAIGLVGITEEDGAITNVFFGDSVQPDVFEVVETALLRRAADQLIEYLRRERHAFDLPIAPQGTAFQRSVWNSLLTIPYGQTRTYGQIATQLGKPTAVRAVGRANGHNPVSIIIPCHRVIGAGGEAVGYAGGVELKLRLLALEEG